MVRAQFHFPNALALMAKAPPMTAKAEEAKAAGVVIRFPIERTRKRS